MKIKMTLVLNDKLVELVKEQSNAKTDKALLSAVRHVMTNQFALHAEQVNPDHPSIESVKCEFID